jgi:hypothetical protein
MTWVIFGINYWSLLRKGKAESVKLLLLQALSFNKLEISERQLITKNWHFVS